MHFYFFITILALSYSLKCSIDKNSIVINTTNSNKFQFTVSNNDESNSTVYVPQNSYFTSDKQIFSVFPGTLQSFQITLKNIDLTLHDDIIYIYCYNQFNPEDKIIFQVKIVNDYLLCQQDDIEVVEGNCNDDSYMTISYRYKKTSKCKQTILPPNEIVRCYKESIMKPASISLMLIFSLLVVLWFIVIFCSYRYFDMFKQYMPPQFIVFYILGILLISLYEGLLSFSNTKKYCFTMICIGGLAHALHAASAISLAQYMYYEDKKILVIKNNMLFLLLRLFIIVIIEIILIAMGCIYYYNYGRDIELLSGLNYTLSMCDNNPSVFIYILPLILKFITIHYYTLYNVISKSSSMYLYQMWRIALSCLMITYYLTAIILSKDYFIGPQRIYLALTVTIIHIFSLFIYYSLGKDVKKENLRPKLQTNILIDDIYRECFRMYLNKDKLDNLLSFWEDFQLFKKFTTNHTDRVHPMLCKIVSTYISVNATKPLVILPNEVKIQILKFYEKPTENYNNGCEVLDKASMIVYSQLENHFPWFLKSTEAEYIDQPYSWLEEYSDYHKSLQYAIRIRMCENAVTDAETGFSYPMSRGRITNPNSCFQLEDIPTIFGAYKVDLKNKIESMNQASAPVDAGGGGAAPLHHPAGGKGNGVGLMALYNNRMNNNNNNLIDSNDGGDTMSRGNVYIPATCATNEGCLAYGYATLATEYSVGGFSSGTTNKTMKSVKIPSTSMNKSITNRKSDATPV